LYSGAQAFSDSRQKRYDMPMNEQQEPVQLDEREHMSETIEQLMYFNFTGMEARTYISLLENPDANGYQLAKILNVSRATVYSSLNSLYRKGAIRLIESESKKYLAKAPRILFRELKQKYGDIADSLGNELEALSVPVQTSQYINISGYTNTMQKIKEMLLDAREEVYLSSNLDLNLIADELAILRERDVRVIAFTYRKDDFSGLDVELYQSDKFQVNLDDVISLILVVDVETAMLANGPRDSSFSGTYSNNKFFVNTLSSHIHFDIDIHLLEKNTGRYVIPHEYSIETKFVRSFREQAHKS
jgi:sugar-specific transcriptional regulator TrmB